MMMAHERMISSRDGVPLRVFDWGDGRNDAVLIVNAYGSRMGLISRLAERLAATKHVISWESRWVPRITRDFDKAKLDVAHHVKDGLDVLAFFGRTRASLIGFCTGAQIALALAASEPERVDRIALLNGSFSFSAAVERTEFEIFFSLLLQKAILSPEMAQSWLAFLAGSRNEGVPEAWARLEQLGASDGDRKSVV